MYFPLLIKVVQGLCIVADKECHLTPELCVSIVLSVFMCLQGQHLFLSVSVKQKTVGKQLTNS